MCVTWREMVPDQDLQHLPKRININMKQQESVDEEVKIQTVLSNLWRKNIKQWIMSNCKIVYFPSFSIRQLNFQQQLRSSTWRLFSTKVGKQSWEFALLMGPLSDLKHLHGPGVADELRF